MKHLIKLSLISILAISASLNLNAQGGFGGFHVNTEYNSAGSLIFFGGGGAWVINQNFYLGGAGYGALNSINTEDGELSSIGYGGFMLGYFRPLKNPKFRIGTDLLIGSGGYKIEETSEDFYFVEPNLKLWYSPSSYIYLGAGVYYRAAFLNADALLNPSNLNNLGFKLTVNFGAL